MQGYDTVVSVNPALSPAGAMNPEVALGAIRNRVYAQGKAMARKQSGRMLRRLFGPTSVSAAMSVMMLVIRVAFGGWCLWEGISGMAAEGFGVLPVLFILASVLIGAGVFTRVTCSCGAAIAAYALCAALSEGQAWIEPAVLTMIFSGIALAGPGRISADILLRHNIFRSISRRNMQKLLDNRFSYRAYEFAHYN